MNTAESKIYAKDPITRKLMDSLFEIYGRTLDAINNNTNQLLEKIIKDLRDLCVV